MNGGNTPGLVAAWRIQAVEVSIVGDLDAWTSQQAVQVLDEAMRQRPEVLIIDLARCHSLDTAGAMLIVQTQQRMRYAGGSLVVRALPHVAMTLRAAGHYGVLQVVTADRLPPRHAAGGR